MSPNRNPASRLALLGLVMLVLLFAGEPATFAGVGPDVTVIEIFNIDNNGATGAGPTRTRAYSIGTTSCNVGTDPVIWCNSPGGCGLGSGSEDHPVIAGNLYRLKSGRFQQIGMSWLKHGFLSTNSFDSGCGSCTTPPLGGDQLGVGCTDTYDAFLNGSRPLGKRSEVNASTGIFPYPYTQVSPSTVVDQRVKVLESDVDPVQNAGARYFAEGQYIAADDAAAGNGLNNASYQEVEVSGASFNLFQTGAVVREQPAIAVWQTIDAAVETANADVSGAIVERFHVARKVTDLGGGTWHYEYAVHNMNSDRAGQSLTITFPSATTFTNVGFSAANHHSGEAYSTAAWTSSTAANSISWASETFATNANANALRFATMFNFWFDANQGPLSLTHSLGLFKPGSPSSVAFSFGPALIFGDSFEVGDTSAWTLTQP